MPSAPAAAAPPPESAESPPVRFRRVRSPLANGGGAAGAGDFELRHWRTPPKRARPSPSQARSPWTPPVIEIPCGGGGGEAGRGGYTSLRDILSSPEYAASSSSFSPAVFCAGGGGSCGDIHMIRHPLVKHAAYAYLQMTPSARDDPGRRHRRRWRGPLCRLLLGCLSFIGALFRP
ncbi:uncharacterized protein LOC121055950 [Oryza brachyantha]|uniref:uncharacterized protein LOC121055950 n=1 Tax=Oryza brachyantha TaxID=4533 RepID=UPI001ADD24E4|nr:uncharacterized protein LOC121055950 [Oryza brachyantha]